MRLEKYLQQNKISDADFGKKIRVTARSVGYYRTGERIPRPKVMERIVKATRGAVTANSFYAAGA